MQLSNFKLRTLAVFTRLFSYIFLIFMWNMNILNKSKIDVGIA